MLPLDDRSWERFNPAVAGRPDLMEGRTEMTVYEGMKGIPENGFINIKNSSFVITADIEIPQAGTEGVVLAQGGGMGGWSLYVKDDKPKFAYNWLGRETYTIAGPARLPAGHGCCASSLLTTEVRLARGVMVRSSSTVKRSPAAASSTLTRTRLARKQRTWARTSTPL